MEYIKPLKLDRMGGGSVRYLTGTQMFNRLPALLKTEPGQYFAHLTLCSAIRVSTYLARRCSRMVSSGADDPIYEPSCLIGDYVATCEENESRACNPFLYT
jgi:hypothetical protein